VNVVASTPDSDAERFRAVVEGAPNAMIMVDQRGIIALVNSQTETLFGYKRTEMLGQSVEVLVPARFRGQHAGLRGGYLKNPEVRAMGAGRELFGLRKDGSEVPVEIGLNPINIADSRFVLASIIDITQRKLAETAYQTSERRYAELVEEALEGIMVRKRTGEIIFANDMLCSMLGYSRAELLCMSIKDLVIEEDAETIDQVQRLNRGGTLRLEKRMHHKNDGDVYVQVSARRLSDGNFQSTIQDVSESKKAETRALVYVEELRFMSRRLLEAHENERRAIARELHDEVGQALTATNIKLQELVHQAGTGPLAPRAAEASAIVSQLLQQVRQLSLNLHPSVLDDLGLAAAFRWCVRTRAESDSLKIVLDMPENLPRFPTLTENTLFRVFQEALSNVLRHAQAAQLTVILRYEDGILTLRVQDDGRGFDPDSARMHAMSGTSLGVIGMQERVRLAGGKIVIESKPGAGTQIQVVLPASPREAIDVTESRMDQERRALS
jgi:PAS domain S-box-containing protein